MFTPTEDQNALIEAAAEFCQGELAPIIIEDEREGRFRKSMMASLGEQGFCGITTEEEYGGLGLGYHDYTMVLEEIAKVSVSYAVGVAVTGLPQVILRQYGNEVQKAQWLPGLATGDLLGAFALSESGSGSDAGSLRTTATREGDDYVINGNKLWITHGGEADLYVVMARTGGPGPKGISAFLVPGNTPGLHAGKKEQKMGGRCSVTAELILDNVRVPATNLLDREGIGFNVAMASLDSGRITIGAIAVGVAQAALDVASAYAVERKQFGHSIIDFQGVGFILADMATSIEASRLMVHKAAMMRDAGMSYSYNAAMAKLYSTDAAMKVTTDAVQVLGGNGYTTEYLVERFMRDAKALQIVEGTNQVQRLVISRHIKRSNS